MKRAAKFLLLGIIMGSPLGARALVDYSPPSSSADSPGPSMPIPLPPRPSLPSSDEGSGVSVRKAEKSSRPKGGGTSSRPVSSSDSFSSGGPKFLGLATTYDSLKTNETQLNRLGLELTLRPVQDLFMDISYWQAQKSGVSMQGGNPKFILGFNWLNFSQREGEGLVDLYGGASFGARSTLLGSSRTDKVFGLESSKRFYSFLVTLGAELTMTGRPQTDDESSIGNIQKFSAGLGWIATPDIRFALETQFLQIQDGGDLKEKASFSALIPRIYLMITPNVEFQLGAKIPTNKVQASQEGTLKRARLWDQPGLFGSSVFLGLSLSV